MTILSKELQINGYIKEFNVLLQPARAPLAASPSLKPTPLAYTPFAVPY